jgi:hypothetical protein
MDSYKNYLVSYEQKVSSEFVKISVEKNFAFYTLLT